MRSFELYLIIIAIQLSSSDNKDDDNDDDKKTCPTGCDCSGNSGNCKYCLTGYYYTQKNDTCTTSCVSGYFINAKQCS